MSSPGSWLTMPWAHALLSYLTLLVLNHKHCMVHRVNPLCPQRHDCMPRQHQQPLPFPPSSHPPHLTSGHNRRLVHRVCPLRAQRHNRVAPLMVGGEPSVLFADDSGPERTRAA